MMIILKIIIAICLFSGIFFFFWYLQRTKIIEKSLTAARGSIKETTARRQVEAHANLLIRDKKNKTRLEKIIENPEKLYTYSRITADDDLSGVKDFYVVIKNTDNAITKTYLPDVDGSIRITITEDEPIFSGDFTVLGYAVDNVGNENNLSYGTTEFALASSVERILSPHDPIFKCGESGILTFTTWGYADRVEVIFPESMTALDPTLNKVYDYTDCPGYMITEHLQFMVPLYTPENQNLEITVRAYKGDKKLEDHPTISVIGVSGTVLDEFRTRLR